MIIQNHCDADGRATSLRWVVYGVLVPVHILLLGWLSCRMSPTSDEIAHLAAGLRIWTTGQFDVYPVNPPLVKAWATIPVVLDGATTDWSRLETSPGARPEWNLGTDYMFRNRPEFRWHFVMARWMCLPFSVLGLIYCFRWGMKLFGPCSGLFAAGLWCFSPNILGNAALITPDVPAAALGIATMYHVSKWIQSGSWADAFVVALLLGLAQLTKMTWLILYGLLPVIWGGALLLRRQQTAEARTRPSLFQLAAILTLSLDVLNAGYLFERSMQPLKEYQFVSRSLKGETTETLSGNRWREQIPGHIPVPLPQSYVTGLDLQRRDFEGGWRPMPSYLNGQLSSRGWWYYYLYGLMVKVPVGAWVITGCGVCLLLKEGQNLSHRNMIDLFILVSVTGSLFFVVSSQTGVSRYFRYLLPCFPFAFVLLSGVWSEGRVLQGSRLVRLANIGAVLFVFESMMVYPQSLSFFNWASGGPERGHWHLLDSNIDWGQDLYELKDWIRNNPQATPLFLSYAGVANPELFDITAGPVPVGQREPFERLPAGWYAISVNHLHGYDDAPLWSPEFLNLVPVARAGYSILIYQKLNDSKP